MICVSICLGSACHLKGSYTVINTLQALIKEHKLEENVEIKASFCLGHCTNGVSVKIDDDTIDNNNIYSVSPSTVIDFFNEEIIRRLNI